MVQALRKMQQRLQESLPIGVFSSSGGHALLEGIQVTRRGLPKITRIPTNAEAMTHLIIPRTERGR